MREVTAGTVCQDLTPASHRAEFTENKITLINRKEAGQCMPLSQHKTSR